MASIIGVETLQHTNGTTAATINTSGEIIPSNPYSGQIIQTQAALFEAGNAHISVASQTSTIMNNANAGNIEISITPKFNNSKILVTLNSSLVFYVSQKDYVWELYRDSTALVTYSSDYAVPNYNAWVYFYDGTSGGISNYHDAEAKFIDTPNTTSQVTYKGYHRGGNNSTAAYACHQGGQMVMTATEIAV